MPRRYTLEDVRVALDLRTIPQARNRVNLIKHDLIAKGFITYGRNNRMELSKDALAILKRMEEMSDQGVPQREAARVVSEEPEATSDTGSLERKIDALSVRLGKIEETLRSGWSISLVPRNDA